MKNKIEIGEYVRTKAGDITKITRFCELEFNKVRINSIVGEDGCLFGNPDKVVKKHSHNIIDLIEVGDYVNGHRVMEVFPKTEKEEACVKLFCIDNLYYDLDIKSIVTKEMFKSISYEVSK